MRIHQFLIVKIIDIDPFLKSFILFIILYQVPQQNVYILLTVIIVAHEDPRHYLERLLRGQHLITNLILKQFQQDLQCTHLLQLVSVFAHLI